MRLSPSTTDASFRAAANRIKRLAREMDKRVPSGIRVIAEEIMTDVKASRHGRGVPKKTGTLASSGRVEGGGRGAGMTVALTFGGAAAPYALAQHEDVSLHHNVGEARYLVRGVERYRPGQAAKALREAADDAVLAARGVARGSGGRFVSRSAA